MSIKPDPAFYAKMPPISDFAEFNNLTIRKPMPEVPKATAQQVGGTHYKDLAIQPVEYIHANKIGYFEGNVIKYVTRWKDKNGIADLEKAKHYIDLLIELELKEL